MSHTSDYYAARIAEVKAESETRAQTLLAKARNGEITWAEAWYSLPGPEPIVQAHNLGGMGPRPQMSYQVQYPFLSAGDAAAMKARVEEEFYEAMVARDRVMQAIPTRHENTTQELKMAVETARKTFDIMSIATAQQKAQVEDLRAKLAAYESAYATGLQEFAAAKQEKERAESAQLDYTSKASALMQVAKAESEVILNRFGKHRDGNAARIKSEGEAWYGLWNDQQTATFDARGREAQARVDSARQAALQARIEEEACRRLRVDAEFESAVAARLQQLQMK
jgi:hypothetical protein